MLTEGSIVLIFEQTPCDRCAIWVWIYCVKVKLDNCPYFLMSKMSKAPVSFSAVSPPAQSEQAPTSCALIACSESLSSVVALRTARTMSWEVTVFHSTLVALTYAQSGVSLCLLFYSSIWCTLCQSFDWTFDLGWFNGFMMDGVHHFSVCLFVCLFVCNL